MEDDASSWLFLMPLQRQKRRKKVQGKDGKREEENERENNNEGKRQEETIHICGFDIHS